MNNIKKTANNVPQMDYDLCRRIDGKERNKENFYLQFLLINEYLPV
jgi:hypothetical protein